MKRHRAWEHSLTFGTTFTPLGPGLTRTVDQLLSVHLIEDGPTEPGRLPTAHVVSIRLHLHEPKGEPSHHGLLHLVQIIKFLRASAPLFSHSQFLQIEAHPLVVRAVFREAPELREHPNPGGQFEYRWGPYA